VPNDPGATRTMDPEEALDLFGRGLRTDDVSPLTGFPLVSVWIDHGNALEKLVRITRNCNCVVIGVSRSEDNSHRALAPSIALGFDLLLATGNSLPSPWIGSPDVHRSLDEIASVVRASPFASLSLVQLLRSAETMTTSDALVAESWVYSMLQSGPEFRHWLSRRDPLVGGVTSDDSPVVVQRRGSALTIELNRPQVHNALNMAMRESLVDAMRVAVADPSVNEVVISGRGSSFCSGGDLTEFGTAPDPVTAHVSRAGRSVGAWLARCAESVTVDVHGGCIGAGIELAAFAGHVRARPDTLISLPEVQMGLIPGAGGTISIPRRIGRHRSAYIALSGRVTSAQTALDWGLVDELAADLRQYEWSSD
jgi:enoyl-CoA hydratase/carnithine racemase